MPFFSSKKKVKLDLKETEREKIKRKMGKTVDPTRAMTEDEPWAVAQQTSKGISQLKHKDIYGNDILDPDRSNPTRHRMERPLDTIRSFEKAIYRDIEDRDYGSRRSKYNNEPQGTGRASVAYNYGDQGARHSTFDNASVYSQSQQQYQQRNVSYQRQSSYDQNYGTSPRNKEVPSTSDTHSGSYMSNGNNSGWSGDPYSTNPSSDASGYVNREHEQQQNGRVPFNGSKPLPPVGRQYSGEGAQGGYPNNYNNQSQYGYNAQAQEQYGNGSNHQYRQSNLSQQPNYASQQQSAWNAQPSASKTLLKSSVGSVNKNDGGKRKSWFRRSKA